MVYLSITNKTFKGIPIRNILDKLNLLGDGPLYMFDRDIMSLRGAE